MHGFSHPCPRLCCGSTFSVGSEGSLSGGSTSVKRAGRGELRPERPPHPRTWLADSHPPARWDVRTTRVKNECEGRGAQGTPGDPRPSQRAAAGRRRHTSGIPGLPTPAPVAGASAPSLPPARPRWKRNYAVRLWFSRDMVEGVTRGRAVGGTSGPQSGQMFPGRLPATYLTSRVGDAARGRHRTGPEPGRAAVRNPRGSVLLAWTNAGRDREGVVTEE